MPDHAPDPEVDEDDITLDNDTAGTGQFIDGDQDEDPS